MPARELNSVRKLGTCTPRPPTLSVPLTKLLNRRGLTGAQLLLALAATKASTLRGCTSTSTIAASTSTTASTTSATAATTSTAATEAPTPSTTPCSTATPSASSTASAAAPTVPSTTLPPLALAVAASPSRGRRRGLTEHRKPESRPVSPESRSASPVRTVRAGRVSSPPVPSTHSMTLCPSTAPQRVPLPSPPAFSLPAGPDPASDSLRAASPAVTRFLATAITDPLFESTAASSLVTELVDFAAACRLDYATSIVVESASTSVCPPSVGGECALGTDVLEDRQEEFECFSATVHHLVSMLIAPEGDPDAPDIPTPRSYAEAIEGPYSSQWQAAMDVEMASWKSTGTDLGEAPRSPPQRGQLRLAYVASQANTADVFTKALQPCDHQPCFAFLDWSCDLLFSPTLPMGCMATLHGMSLANGGAASGSRTGQRVGRTRGWAEHVG
ncbi:unnamed protein product [Closterium sp. NIES-53]